VEGKGEEAGKNSIPTKKGVQSIVSLTVSKEGKNRRKGEEREEGFKDKITKKGEWL